MNDQVEIDVVTQRLGSEMMAITTGYLREILEPMPVTRVPAPHPLPPD